MKLKSESENKISTPEDVEHILRNILNLDKKKEDVTIILTFYPDNKKIGSFELSGGKLNKNIVSSKELEMIMKLTKCTSFIVARNCINIDESPRIEDIKVAEILSEVGKSIGIPMLDFLIVGSDLKSLRRYKCLQDEYKLLQQVCNLIDEIE